MELSRAYLETLLHDDLGRRYSEDAWRPSFWLRDLARTNLTDLELVVGVLESYRFDQFVALPAEVAEVKGRLSFAPSYLKALFSFETL